MDEHTPGFTDKDGRIERMKHYMFVVMPMIISMFCIITITLLSPMRWLTALIQLPVWVALVWWLYVKEEYYGD